MKKRLLLVLGALAFVPYLAHADTFRTLVEGKILPFGDVVIQLLYGLAFLFFLAGMARYFLIGAANEESRDQGKKHMIWGIIAIVVLFGVWGIVKLMLSIIGAPPA